MSTYKKRKKARKAQEKADRETWMKDKVKVDASEGYEGFEELYRLEIDMRTATYLTCVEIDKGAGEYIMNTSKDWRLDNWIYLLVFMKTQYKGLDKVMKYVSENDDWYLDPGTLFPEGV